MSSDPRPTASTSDDTRAAIDRAHEWFHHNSGWAPPDEETLADWLAEDLCRAPDDCMTTPTGWCEHGLASWWLVLEDSCRPAGHTVPADSRPPRSS